MKLENPQLHCDASKVKIPCCTCDIRDADTKLSARQLWLEIALVLNPIAIFQKLPLNKAFWKTKPSYHFMKSLFDLHIFIKRAEIS